MNRDDELYHFGRKGMKWGKNLFKGVKDLADKAQKAVGLKEKTRMDKFRDDIKEIKNKKQGINTDALAVTLDLPSGIGGVVGHFIGNNIGQAIIRKLRYDEDHLFHPDSAVSKTIEAFGDGVRIMASAIERSPIGDLIPDFTGQRRQEKSGKAWVSNFIKQSKKKVKRMFD